ncbi:hypothetical protein N0V82_008505 [Gnomoniopsis sp. IMI 355080]|nr:hypothetical protein N0V82_008505 [Gnomoniopsis sp. IMI 355080]
MPPKPSTDRPYGLSDAEMKACICVLRLLAIDGNIPIDKVALAKLTGHDKPNSAVKIWSLAKAKLVAADVGASPDNATSGEAANRTPTKRGRPTNKTKPVGGKKVAARVDEDEDEVEDEGGEDGLDEPAPKRGKSIITKLEPQDDSF